MFTGIIESVGTVAGTQPAAGGRRLRVEVGPMAQECTLGASIAVDGVCLTVAAEHHTSLTFDVIRETLERSTLGLKRSGDRVNLERSLRVGDRLDGHFMQGHVDGTASVERVQSSPQEWVLWLRPDEQLVPFIVPKGSVAVDGVSLTIAEVAGTGFSVALIPTTLERTTLSSLTVGDRVNIETDIIVRAIVQRLSAISNATLGGLSLETLREAGFA
ncbi:MAG: riboflavin synthase [Phycisphaerae bacterium]